MSLKVNPAVDSITSAEQLYRQRNHRIEQDTANIPEQTGQTEFASDTESLRSNVHAVLTNREIDTLNALFGYQEISFYGNRKAPAVQSGFLLDVKG